MLVRLSTTAGIADLSAFSASAVVIPLTVRLA